MAGQWFPTSIALRPPALSDKVERIEYPGRIVHVDRALATLGGSAELVKQFRQKTVDAAKGGPPPVQLSLRFGLATSQPGAADAPNMTCLTSDSSKSKGFVLCITLDESGAASDANIEAYYDRTHSFRRLADLVYRQDSPSAASCIAKSGVINGVSPSIAQVSRVSDVCNQQHPHACLQLECMGPFKLPVPHRIGFLDAPLPAPTVLQNVDPKLLHYKERRLAEFQTVRPKCHKCPSSSPRFQQPAQTFPDATHTHLSIDHRCEATPAHPPAPIQQLHLSSSEREIYAKLAEMFEYQVPKNHARSCAQQPVPGVLP
jgi:hypothetical protein